MYRNQAKNQVSLSRAVLKYADGDKKGAVMTLFLFFDKMYKDKVQAASMFQSRREAAKSSSTRVMEWMNTYERKVASNTQVAKALEKIAKEVEQDGIELISSEGTNIGKNFVARYRYCKRFFEMRTK